MKRNFNWNSFPAIAHAIPEAMALTDYGMGIIRREEIRRGNVGRASSSRPAQADVHRNGTIRAVRS